MKRLIVHLKKLFALYILPPSIDPDVSGFKPIKGVHYLPAPDEPSLFGNTPDEVSKKWIAWHMKRNPSHSYPTAFQVAAMIKTGLQWEPNRHYSPGYLPPVLLGPCKAISLEWVIWYKYTFGGTFHEAHLEALKITTKH